MIGQACTTTAEDGKWNFHHIKTVSDGGAEHDIANGALLHQHCHTHYYVELHGRQNMGAFYAMSGKARKYWKFRMYAGKHRPPPGERSTRQTGPIGGDVPE